MRVVMVLALITSVSAAACSLTFAHRAEEHWTTSAGEMMARRALIVSRDLMDAATAVAGERGPTNAVLGAAKASDSQRATLFDARAETDVALRAAREAGEQLDPTRRLSVRDALGAVSYRLEAARSGVNRLLIRTLPERKDSSITQVVSGLVGALQPFGKAFDAAEAAMSETRPALVNWLVMARTATELRDYAGQIGSVFTAALAAGRPLTDGELARYDQLLGRTDALIQEIGTTHDRLADERLDHDFEVINQRFMTRGQQLSAAVVERSRTGLAADVTAAGFAERYVPELASIVEFRDLVLERAAGVVEAEAEASRAALAWNGVIAALLATISLVLVGACRHEVMEALGQLTGRRQPSLRNLETSAAAEGGGVDPEAQGVVEPVSRRRHA